MQKYYSCDKNASEVVGYERSEMQKDIILQRLRNRGCRITKQRMMLLDIILNEECSCCKESSGGIIMAEGKILILEQLQYTV